MSNHLKMEKDLTIEKVKCKDFYWHLINIQTHMPNNIYKWCEIYPDLKKTPDSKTWPRIFKLPFNLIRETNIQTFLYKILHIVIPCNKWLYNIKIQTSETCDYCKGTDNIPHFFLYCPKVKKFWDLILNWLENVSNLELKNSPILEECFIFGFPESNMIVKEKIYVINSFTIITCFRCFYF